MKHFINYSQNHEVKYSINIININSNNITFSDYQREMPHFTVMCG